MWLYGIVVPAIHFNSVAKDKCYFVQSSSYIHAKRTVFRYIQIIVGIALDWF